MTRRSFLKNLAATAAVLAVPVGVLAKHEPPYFAMMREETERAGRAISNAYHFATYGDRIWIEPDAIPFDVSKLQKLS